MIVFIGKLKDDSGSRARDLFNSVQTVVRVDASESPAHRHLDHATRSGSIPSVSLTATRSFCLHPR